MITNRKSTGKIYGEPKISLDTVLKMIRDWTALKQIRGGVEGWIVSSLIRLPQPARPHGHGQHICSIIEDNCSKNYALDHVYDNPCRTAKSTKKLCEQFFCWGIKTLSVMQNQILDFITQTFLLTLYYHTRIK